MTTLIRYNKKKDTGIFYNSNNGKFVKFYKNKKKSFKNELNGYDWYLKQLKKKKIKIPSIKKLDNGFEIKTIKGKQFNYWNNHILNERLILSVIKHYKLIWPVEKFVPFHGDLTIENIIFKKNKVLMFIDWEGFKIKKNWGLDLCYFLISLIVLPILTRKGNYLNKSNLIKFEEIWQQVFKNKNYPYLKDPINYIKRNCVNKNNFFNKITKKIKSKIDRVINKN